MSEITTLPTSTLMTFIERAARDDTFNVEKFSALLSLQRDAEHEQARRAFNVAMASCQAQMEPVLRGTPNPGTRSKYAKLEDIDRQMRPVYTGHGFSVRFGSDAPPQPGWMRITCTVAHDAGYYETNYLDSPVSTVGSQGGRIAMTGVQAVGSVTTYLRRYLLGMVFNIVQADIVGEDDDGEAQRAAAADAKKPARKVDSTVYETPPKSTPDTDRTDAQWRVWLDKMRAAGDVLYRREEFVEMANRASIGEAIANGPPWVRSEISAYLAEGYARFPEEPEGEELDEVRIVGEEKVAAG